MGVCTHSHIYIHTYFSYVCNPQKLVFLKIHSALYTDKFIFLCVCYWIFFCLQTDLPVNSGLQVHDITLAEMTGFSLLCWARSKKHTTFKEKNVFQIPRLVLLCIQKSEHSFPSYHIVNEFIYSSYSGPSNNQDFFLSVQSTSGYPGIGDMDAFLNNTM